MLIGFSKLFVFTLFFVGGALSFAADGNVKGAARQAPKVSQPGPSIVLNEIARTAASYGVRDCLPRINQVTGFLVGPAQNGAVMFLSPDHTNKVLQGLSLEVVSNGMVSYVSNSYASGPGSGECSSTYDTVTYWPNSCADLQARVFTAFKKNQPLYKHITSLEDGPLIRVFLMPAGSGCVSIKKETIYP